MMDPKIFIAVHCLFQNGSSSDELQIKNAQVKHAGLYSCTAQTPADNVTASARLIVRGRFSCGFHGYKLLKPG